MIQTYFETIKRLIHHFSSTPFVIDARVEFDIRPGDQGYVVGRITFRDETILHFREYLDVSGHKVEKLSYTYHYQTKNGHLIFRYDNAKHRPPLKQREHKHVPGKIIPASVPTLEDILFEILSLRFREQLGS